MKKVLILGASGMLGHRLYLDFRSDFQTFATIRNWSENLEALLPHSENIISGVDATDFLKLKRVIEELKPDFVVNCIGVIKQHHEISPATTIELNSVFPWRLSELLAPIHCKLVCISTDCVFTGDKGNYSEEDAADAQDIYGRSKALGEVVLPSSLVLRTSILGREVTQDLSLFEWFLSKSPGESIRGYRSAMYSGFPTHSLAKIIKNILLQSPDLQGLYHLSSSSISKFELLSLINTRLQRGVKIEAVDEPKIDRSLSSEKIRKVVPFPIEKEWDQLLDDLFFEFDKYEALKQKNEK